MFIGSKLYQRLLDAFTTCHPDNGQVGNGGCIQNLLDNGKIFSKGTWPCFLFWYLVKTCCSGDQPSVRQWAVDDHQAGQGWQCRWKWFGQDLFLHEMLAFDWFCAGEVDLELFNAVIEDLEENALKNKQRRRREVRAGVWECGERSLLVSIKIDENFWVCAGCAWVDPDHIP